MAERRIVNGWIYERGDDGQIRAIAPAQPQMPADPTFQYKGPAAQADLANTQTNVQGNVLENQYDAATLPARVQKAEADARAAAAAAAKAERELNAPSAPQAEQRDRLSRLNQLAGQVNRVQELYNTGVGTTKGLMGVQDYLPLDTNAQFDTAGAALSQQGLAAFRVPGTGTVSDRDAMMFDRANLPTAATRDVAIQEQLRGLRARVDEERKALGLPPVDWTKDATAQPQNDRQDAAAALIGGAAGGAGSLPTGSPPVAPGGGGVINGVPGSGEGPVVTPNDQAYAAELQKVYNGGGSVPQMIAVAQKYGFDPRVQPVADWQQAIDYRDGTGAYQGKPRGLSQVRTPASGQRSLAQNTFGNAALSPVGAAALASADAGTFGLVDEAAALAGAAGGGNYAAMRDYYDAGKRSIAAQNPGASAVGTIAGGIAGGMGVESLVARTAGRFGRAAQALAQPYAGAIADGALYGGALGAGQNNNDRLGGAANGALVGAIGGSAGTAALRGTGAVMRGVQNEAVQRLSDAGVSLSPGQMLGNGGAFGRAVKRLEDAGESIPGIGSIIRSRREGSFQDFNRAAFRDALSPIKETVKNNAEEGVEEAKDAVARGYKRALNGVNLQPDQQFGAELRQAVATGQGAGGQFADDFNTILQGEIQPIFQGRQAFSGQDVQDLMRITRNYARQYGELGTRGANGVPQPSARPVGEAFARASEALEGLLNRQAPEVLPAYGAANSAFRNVGVIQDAVDAAKAGTQSGNGGVFTPAQLSRAASRNAKKFGRTQGTTDQPFFQLTRDAQDVLPSELPNSGTADRALSAGLMGVPVLGAGVAAQQGWIDPETALGLASLAGAYSRPGSAAIQRGLVSRPAAVRDAGQAVIDRGRYGGLLGSALGFSLFPQ